MRMECHEDQKIMLLNLLDLPCIPYSAKMLDLSAANPCGPPLPRRLSDQGRPAESTALILLTSLSLHFCFSGQVKFWFSCFLFNRRPKGCECMSVSTSTPLTQRQRLERAEEIRFRKLVALSERDRWYMFKVQWRLPCLTWAQHP